MQCSPTTMHLLPVLALETSLLGIIKPPAPTDYCKQMVIRIFLLHPSPLFPFNNSCTTKTTALQLQLARDGTPLWWQVVYIKKGKCKWQIIHFSTTGQNSLLLVRSGSGSQLIIKKKKIWISDQTEHRKLFLFYYV